MGVWTGLRINQGGISGGFDSIILSSAGNFQLCEIQGCIYMAPNSQLLNTGAQSPPDPIVGIGAIPSGTGPVPIATHLASSDYFYAAGAQSISGTEYGATITTAPTVRVYTIPLKWSGVFSVAANTDWYISAGFAEISVNCSWFGWVRIKNF
jgi:hypothetical protein